MDLKEIQNLIKFIAKSGVVEVELSTDDFDLVVKNEHEGNSSVSYMQAPMQAAPSNVQTPAFSTSQDANATDEEDLEAAGYEEIKSPMIGTFYRKPSPDKDVFVKVGDTVKKGDTVCIIEAMKLFNEIEAEVSGTIVKALVDDSTPVEYDQPLFIIDPKG